MNPGDMKDRGWIQSVVNTPDEGAGWVESWLPESGAGVEMWARIEPMSGSEQLRAMEIGVTQPHRIVIRYRPGVTPKMRFVEIRSDGNRIHEITSVHELERRRYLELVTDVLS